LKKPEPARIRKIALLLALSAVLAALFLAQLRERARERPEDLVEAPVGTSPAKARRVRTANRTGAGTRSDTARSCAPAAFLRCHAGDVWSEDSCGGLETKVEDCHGQLCREAACEEPDPEPCVEPNEGRCDGDVVRLCYAGRAQQIDCAARGMRCLAGEEGAECGPLLSMEQRCSGPVHCEGDALVYCRAGQRERVDCKRLGGRCEALGPAEPRCVQHKLPLEASAACPACGCPPSAQGERACDGRDDDGDGYVDEALSCGEIPIMAFVIGDSAGESSFARDEIEQEIERANTLLAQEADQPELRFVLAEFGVVRAENLLELSSEELSQLASDPRFHPRRDAFYVPVVFSDVLFAPGEVPRVGVSTLPNGYCGGVQRGHAPEVGIVGISKARSSTTLLHELGHFFGLCHTHDLSFGLQTVADDPARASAMLCDERCRHEGDGACDTPLDPGPDGCRYDAACRPLCVRGEAPDASNLMSYYTACRERFSPEQRRRFEHTLALRRGWHACLSIACPCELAGAECPVGMACVPGSDAAAAGRCVLAGPRAAGAECQTHAQCAAGLCLVSARGSSREPNTDAKRELGRCVRACRAPLPGCTCTETSLGTSICREDVGS
jgi:hypothetical protein